MRIVEKLSCVDLVEDGKTIARFWARNGEAPGAMIQSGKTRIVDSSAQLERLGMALVRLARRNMEVSR